MVFIALAAAPTFSARAGETNTIDKRIWFLFYFLGGGNDDFSLHITRREFTNLQQKSLNLSFITHKKN
jgi:hypothetical protein